jgi:transposase
LLIDFDQDLVKLPVNTPAAKEVYKLRRQIVEPVIGDIKENKGLRTFLTRGIDAVRTESNLACSAVNLKKIWAYLKEQGRPPKKSGCLASRKSYLNMLWTKQIAQCIFGS